MKKTLVSAITSALVIGAASTTFAAANPFSDVPEGHWAYDHVAKLAASGVLDGYGDNTFRGERSITRYEMAKMVATILAKVDSGKKVTTTDKALIDRLAAEFSDELNNLGVRVAKLEKNADMVKWTGELRYRYWSRRVEDTKGGKTVKHNTDQLQLRLFPTAEVNDHWHVKARLTASNNMKTDESSNVKLTYAYAQGDYKNFNVKMGKMPLYSVADDGLVVDDFFSGFEVNAGSKLKVTLQGGRWNLDNTLQEGGDGAATQRWTNYGKQTNNLSNNGRDTAANYWGAELNYKNGKLDFGAAYRNFQSDAFKGGTRDALGNYTNGGIYGYKANKDKASIWSVGGKYAFTKSIALKGAYAQNGEAEKFKNGYNIELQYKGADRNNAHTWGMYAAYRAVGQNVGLAPTYDTYIANTKGWTVGLGYVPFKNTLTEIGYFDGKKLDDKRKAKTLYARVSAFF